MVLTPQPKLYTVKIDGAFIGDPTPGKVTIVMATSHDGIERFVMPCHRATKFTRQEAFEIFHNTNIPDPKKPGQFLTVEVYGPVHEEPKPRLPQAWEPGFDINKPAHFMSLPEWAHNFVARIRGF